jgi:hypothetical protein
MIVPYTSCPDGNNLVPSLTKITGSDCCNYRSGVFDEVKTELNLLLYAKVLLIKQYLFPSLFVGVTFLKILILRFTNPVF